MVRTVVFAPGTTSAGDNIDLPSGSPPIAEIVNALLFSGSDGSAAASSSTVTATKVDEDTITLDSATTGRDLLVLRYTAVGEYVAVE